MAFHILTCKVKTAVAVPFLLFFLFQCTLNSQAQYTLSIKQVNEGSKTESKLFNEIDYQKNFSDSLSPYKEVNKFLARLYEKGFLAASLDSAQTIDKSLVAFIFVGKQYEWAQLGKGNVNEEFLNSSGFSEKNFRGKPFSIKRFAQLQQKILTECENNGYPFAGIRLDSVEIKDEGIRATLNLTKGDLVKIDSILIKGTAKIKPVYLFNYLNIKKDDVYREKIIKSISARLKELPMVSELKPYGIEFYEDKARVILYLENKRASQIDGIIGVLPDAGNEGKVVVTGDARLRLFSSFGRGELIDLNWKQPAPKTQDLKVKFNYPFLFSSPFALDAGINIYKKDSTFTDVLQALGFQYLLPGNNFFKVFISNKNSSLIANSTLQFISVLPPYADVQTFTYGAGFKFEKVDYRLNPRTGFSGELTGGVGTKKIKQNNKIKPELYNGLDLNTTQYSSEYSLDFYFPIGKRMVLNTGSKGAYFFAPEIFTNELFRFGGLKTLRGFDEESVFATEFYTGKLEYRYILEQNSYLFTFFNAAYYANQSREAKIYDTPIGFGAGITFETKLGIFSLNYALGKAFDNPIIFRSAKVHFGILNYF